MIIDKIVIRFVGLCIKCNIPRVYIIAQYAHRTQLSNYKNITEFLC